MNRKSASDFPQELLDLYDDYAHGRVDRRGFFDRAAKFAVGGITAAALLEALSPNYAWAQQVPKDDKRIVASYEEYDSPKGAGKMRGYLVKPAGGAKKPGIVVIHENRGLNPYIEDVARRLATADFVAFAPDALFPLGGYPGDDDKGKEMQAKRDTNQMTEDFIAAALWLQKNDAVFGKIGVVGFCFGGGMSNTLAYRIPEVIAAAVPFYGRQPAAEEAAKIKGQMLFHFGELDKGVNGGWPTWEAALKQAGVKYTAHVYPAANHGFHNDTTPRYDEKSAKLAWERTIEFFNKTLRPA